MTWERIIWILAGAFALTAAIPFGYWLASVLLEGS
jgi:hypothetical protein